MLSTLLCLINPEGKPHCLMKGSFLASSSWLVALPLIALFFIGGCATVNNRDTFYASGTQEPPRMTALKARENILRAYPYARINRDGIQLVASRSPFLRFVDIASMDIESPLFSFKWVITIHPYGYTIDYDMGNYGGAKLLVDSLYALKYAAAKGPSEEEQTAGAFAAVFGETDEKSGSTAAVHVPTSDELEAIRRTKNEKTLEDTNAYQQAKSLNTLQAYAEFLHSHPSSPSRRGALEAMCLLIKNQKGSYEGYREFVVEYEDGMEFVPPRHRLALTGPEGMRVNDIVRLLRRGIKDTVIAAKIRTRNALYKDFDFEEIESLKKMGITDALIEAMLDSTTRTKRAQEEFQKKKEMENLLAEIKRTQKKLDTMKAAQQQPQTAGSEQQASGPSLGETVKNCAAQIAALEACKSLPWFGQAVCKATAKSQFPCQ